MTSEITDNGIGTEYPSCDAGYCHDLNGNMTGWDGTTYAWDARNRLIAINGPSLDASFTYDVLGRRIAKTVNGTTTKYLYDGADIVMEMDSGGVATAYYIHGPGVDEPLARVTLNSSGAVTGIRFYLADALGSVIALADENGDVKTRYNYTPFGEPETIGEASDNPFMFTGRISCLRWTGTTLRRLITSTGRASTSRWRGWS